MTELFKKHITKDQSRDTGMAMVLLLLILFGYLKRETLLVGAIVLHVLNMTVPQAYKWVAVVWLGLSHLLGTVVSKILMSAAFFIVVTPVGVLRRISGHDSLKLHEFKASDESVMVVRNHKFSAADIERPY